MAEILTLEEAVRTLVRDGDTVALEGFTHLIPFAAGHEIIRQRRRDLTLIRMTPGPRLRPADRRRAARASSSSPGAATPASARCTASATRSSTTGRRRCEIEEHSHAGMANRYAAGASGPAVRGAARLRRHRPDRAAPPNDRGRHLPVHRRGAHRGAGAQPGRRRSSTPSAPTARATCSCGASSGCRRRRCSRPARSLVTVEEVVDELEPRPGAVVLPTWAVDGGRRGARAARTRPTRRATTTATTTSTRRWDAISRDRDDVHRLAGRAT